MVIAFKYKTIFYTQLLGCFLIVKRLDGCPTNELEYKKVISDLHCFHSLQGHCLLDEEQRPVLACLNGIWIQTGWCPVFNSRSRKVTVLKCDGELGKCPDAIFYSNESYKYPVCLKVVGDTDLSFPVISTVGPENQTRQGDVEPKAVAGAVPTFVIIIVVITIVVIASVIMVIVIIIRRRKKEERNSTEVDLEMTSPLRGNTSEASGYNRHETENNSQRANDPHSKEINQVIKGVNFSTKGVNTGPSLKGVATKHIMSEDITLRDEDIMRIMKETQHYNTHCQIQEQDRSDRQENRRSEEM